MLDKETDDDWLIMETFTNCHLLVSLSSTGSGNNSVQLSKEQGTSEVETWLIWNKGKGYENEWI